ncbi:hypothetical protein [Flavobacterium sp. ENC]|uniref:hypothetical protein n=1 Tax=Flavobacterium sp. ENC TaxID=2897330 RepID=UPI001E388DDB|nr:hypothetical protein [Flavobacterium sp. ENC]MCD0467657.1 hypothetical protein [Flavobacterium sp. ENC]
MLDFYLIKDEQITPDSPTGLEFIGQLNDRTFRNLQNKGVIDKRYEYHSDFRWDIETILQMRLNGTKLQTHKDTDIIQLFQIIDISENKKSGIIAFGD